MVSDSLEKGLWVHGEPGVGSVHLCSDRDAVKELLDYRTIAKTTLEKVISSLIIKEGKLNEQNSGCGVWSWRLWVNSVFWV